MTQAAFLLGTAILAPESFAEDHTKLRRCEPHEAQPCPALGEGLPMPCRSTRAGDQHRLLGACEGLSQHEMKNAFLLSLDGSICFH